MVTSIDLVSRADFDTKRPDVGYWPGTVSSYYDRKSCLRSTIPIPTCWRNTAYVASIWNSYRKACLLVLNIILSCEHRINNDTSIQKDVAALTEGIVSSPISPSCRSTGLRWKCHSGIKNCPRSTSRCSAVDVHTICFINDAYGGREAKSLYKRLFDVDWKAHGHRSSHLIIQGEILTKSQGEEKSWLES